MIFLYLLLTPFLLNAQTDTSSVQADSAMIEPIKYTDTLVIFSSLPLSQTSTFISNETLSFSDYRFVADFFSSIPFAFQRSFGSYGQPNELLLYGGGFGNASVLRNNFDLTNAATNFYDYNFIQSEDVDSIEIIRSPRAFLYGYNANNVAINFISKDIISNYPYTRIKYYEGNFGEAMIDARAGIFLFKRLNFNLDITNRKQDDSYKRTSFSHWLGKANLKYYASSLFNVYAEYFYSRKITDLNGGVNLDSIKTLTTDINNIMYAYLSAPVLYLERYQKEFRNNLNVGSLFQYGNLRTELNFSLQNEKREYRFEEKDSLRSNLIDQDYSTKVFTLNSHYQILPDALSANFIFQSIKYESESIFSTMTAGLINKLEEDATTTTLSSNLTGKLFSDRFIPSLFFRYSKIGGSSFGGFGADFNFHANDNISLYAGFSSYQLSSAFYYNVIEFPKTNSLETELKIKYLQFDFTLGMYYRAYQNLYFEAYPAEWNVPPSVPPLPNRLISDLGFSTKLIFPIWKIWFEGFITHESKKYDQHESGKIFSFNPNPSLHSTINIFYRDSLFTNNLELQTGFTIRYYKSNWLLHYENFSNRSFYVQPEVKNDYQIDFVASGRIQKTAIVYFAWENLLDREYFMYAYYPMYRRGIRFGLAWEFLN